MTVRHPFLRRRSKKSHKVFVSAEEPRNIGSEQEMQKRQITLDEEESKNKASFNLSHEKDKTSEDNAQNAQAKLCS